jgi:hypothetical protein
MRSVVGPDSPVPAHRGLAPASGALDVAAAGPGWVFALNTLSFLGIAAVLVRWRPADRADDVSRERLVEALRAGVTSGTH